MPNNNIKIAKNTLVLFVRMLFTVIISLYSSRLVLQGLGEENYGVYNVVGGVVSMFSIITTSLSISISRFITYELGTKEPNRLRKVFSTSLLIQIALTIIVILLVETLGVWFLTNKMTIPLDRMSAAMFVLQCSMGSFIIGLLFVPYNAAVIAHEKMGVYAYTSIVEVILKLILAFYLVNGKDFGLDKLKVYAIGLLVFDLLSRSITIIYARNKFSECKGWVKSDMALFKDMLSFAGWSFWGSAANMFNSQGTNIVTNIFWGPSVNAARGLANTVNNVAMGFVNSFTTALNPQIMKNYASKEDVLPLVYRGAKFSFIILFVVSMPILLETEVILGIWLVSVPEYTNVFMRFVLVASLIDILSCTLNTAQNATGDLKLYQILLSISQFLSFFVSAIALKLGARPFAPYLIWIPFAFTNVVIRVLLLSRHLPITLLSYIKNVMIPVCCVVVISAPLSVLTKELWANAGQISTILIIMTSAILTALTAFFVGCTKEEKHFIVKIVDRKLNMLK